MINLAQIFQTNFRFLYGTYVITDLFFFVYQTVSLECLLPLYTEFLLSSILCRYSSEEENVKHD